MLVSAAVNERSLFLQRAIRRLSVRCAQALCDKGEAARQEREERHDSPGGHAEQA
jgi:hypothetical protein